MKQNKELNLSFSAEIELIEDLCKTLRLEQDALVASNIDEIESTLEKKSEVIKKISKASAERHKLLCLMGFDSSEKGMVDWLKSQNKEDLSHDWHKLQVLLESAKELNRLNAMLVNKFVSRNQSTIESVNRNMMRDTSKMYGANGLPA